MNIGEIFLLLLRGFGNNVLITVLATFLPLVLGVVLTILAGKLRYVGRIAEWLSLPFECITPIILIVCVCFTTPDVFATLGFGNALREIFNSAWFIGIALSVAFVGYMPARYNPSASILKNCLCNGIGLICTAFQWSFSVGFVGTLDMLKAAMIVGGELYNYWVVVPIFLVSAVLLGVPQIAKRLCSQFLK